MKRIIILGPGNAGKSTLAAKLGGKLNLPVHHLDKYFWKEDWVMATDQEQTEIHDALIKEDRWVIDGGFSNLLDDRLARADTVVLLNFPRRVTIPRWFRRMWMNRSKSRSDMGGNNVERFNWEYMRMLINSKDQSARAERISQAAPHVKVYLLSNARQVHDFLAQAE